jgi:predicted DsbA family dithiol-disulfide isomerase
MSMTKPVIKVDIVSDVVCPWCYIGKRRIEKAMTALTNEFDFEVNYLPFELNPQTPKEGFNQKEYLTKKFGSEEKYNQITSHVTNVAAGEGLQFNFDKQRISPNTKDAHRVIWLAKKEGKQLEAKEAFMKAYFEQGVDLTKKENIISVASSIGLDAARVVSFLDSQEGLQEVNELEQLNHQRGVSGVPFYIINNQYGISGAQPADVFIQALKQIGTEVATAEGEACDVESKNC